MRQTYLNHLPTPVLLMLALLAGGIVVGCQPAEEEQEIGDLIAEARQALEQGDVDQGPG